jgi:hypothetical protein
VVQFLLLEGADPCARNAAQETPRQTCGHDIEPGVREALTIAEKQWPAALASAVPEPSTPPSSGGRESNPVLPAAEPMADNAEDRSS